MLTKTAGLIEALTGIFTGRPDIEAAWALALHIPGEDTPRQLVGDGDDKDRNVCVQPVQIQPELRIAKCLALITADDVIRRIEMYYRGGALQYNDTGTVEGP